jgi:uncharacterized membrane protein
MNRRRALLWVVFCGLVLSLPMLIVGFPNPTHDGRVHEVWFGNFAAQFWAGDWYPRWLQQLDGGLGGPSFYFYPPMPYVITALFQPLFRGAADSWRILGLSVALALVLSGAFAYLWLRQMVDERTAGIAAVLYMAMPYHYAVDLFARGALGEFWSFAWLPLILYCTHGVVQRRRLAFVGLAFSYVMLIMTHLPTTLIFSVIPPVYAVWLAAPSDRVRAFRSTSAAMALGIGLSAIYLLPAMRDQGAVSMDAMRTGGFYYEFGYFFARNAAGVRVLATTNFVKALFGIVLSMCAVATAAVFVVRRSAKTVLRREMIFWCVVALVSLAMMFPISKPLYELLPPLQLIQFPWRFNAILTLAVAALLALAMAAAARPYRWPEYGALVVGISCVFYWANLSVEPLQYTTFAEPRPMAGAMKQWFRNNSNTPEYRPHWSRVEIGQLIRTLRNGTDTIAKTRVTRGTAAVRVTQWRPRSIALAVSAPADATIEVSQFYYPTWTATADEKTGIAVAPSSPNGLVQLSVPAGAHTIGLRLEDSRAERTGKIISTAALVVFAAAVLLTLGATARPHTSQA